MASYSAKFAEYNKDISKVKIKIEPENNPHEIENLSIQDEIINDNDIKDFNCRVSDLNQNLSNKHDGTNEHQFDFIEETPRIKVELSEDYENKIKILGNHENPLEHVSNDILSNASNNNHETQCETTNYFRNEDFKFPPASNAPFLTITKNELAKDDELISYRDEFMRELQSEHSADTEKKFACPECDRAFALKRYLVNHLRSHRSKSNSCDATYTVPKRNSNKIAKRNSNKIPKTNGSDVEKDKNYLCDICNLTFVTESIFIAHFAAHNDENYFKYGNAVNTTNPNREPSTTEVAASCPTPPQPYSCEKCGKQFKYGSQLKVHKFSHSGKQFVCNVCGKLSRNYFSWKTHEKRHTHPKTFACHECGKVYKYKVNLKTHLIHHLGSFKCEICSENFSNQYSLDWHVKRHKSQTHCAGRRTVSSSKRYHCEYCDVMFKIRLAYQSHISEHKANSDLLCKHCGQSFKFLANLAQHLRQHNAFKCDRCVKSFETEESLNEHVVVHTDDENFKCNYCEKVFSNKYTLYNHVNGHLRDFKCNVCPRTFDTIVELQKHAEIHSRNTKKCEYCGKEYDFYSQLAIHVKTHTKSYKCDSCDKSFDTNVLLAKHTRKAHEAEHLVCHYCNKSFGYQSSLAYHMRTHNRKYRCDMCQASFDNWPRYDKHVKSHESPFDGFKCDECDKCFKYHSQLRAHVKNHKKAHRCDECQMTFKHWRSYNKHKKIVHEHAYAADFPCGYCDMVFKFRSQLKYHLPVHNRQYKCHCGKTFNSKTYFEYHQNSHTKEMPKCEHCGKEFKYHSSLKLHAKTHTKAQPIECYHCGRHAKSRFKLIKHIFAAHMEPANANAEPLKCKHCEKTFKYSSQLKAHAKVHTRRYNCSKCSKSFDSRRYFECHVRIHTNEKLTCQFCGKVYKYYSLLRYHLKTHSKSRTVAKKSPSLNCNYCGKFFQFQSTLKLHMKKHTGAKPFKCKFCDKKFAWKKSVSEHLLAVHEHKSDFRCDSCKRYFMYRSQYEEHSNACALKLEYVCKYCGKRLKTRYTYKLHLLQHVGTKEYNCAECDKTFYTKPVLVKHLRTHLEKETLTCTFCGLQFTSEFRYNSHLDRHVHEFRCNICERKFKQKYKLKRHIMTVHQRGATCSCNVCGKLFLRESALNAHSVKHFIQGNEQLLRFFDGNNATPMLSAVKCENQNDDYEVESKPDEVEMLIPEIVYENQT